MKYDPAVAPNRKQWLALDEGERIALVEDYHRRAKIDVPRATLHAAIHAVIEQQLAEQLPQVVNAFDRLRAEGLDRHDTIHALGAVLTEHLRQLVIGELDENNPNAAYFAALDALTAASWRRDFGEDEDDDAV
jgi:UDP-N-acetylmuramyl tripeptide synthase